MLNVPVEKNASGPSGPDIIPLSQIQHWQIGTWLQHRILEGKLNATNTDFYIHSLYVKEFPHTQLPFSVFVTTNYDAESAIVALSKPLGRSLVPNPKDTEDPQLFTGLPRYHTLMVMLLEELRASLATTERPKALMMTIKGKKTIKVSKRMNGRAEKKEQRKGA